MSDAGPLVLLDTATLYFRAFHGMPSTILTPDGRPCGAVRGTLDSLAVLIARLRPSQVIACWDDDWRPAWRTALLPSYKAHRVASDGGEEVPDGLEAQVEGVAAFLEAVGVPRIGAPGAEADDVAATLAAAAASAGRDVEVVSGDRDLFQVVSEPSGSSSGRVRVVFIGRGVREAPAVDAAGLAARCGLSGEALGREGGVGAAYADLAVLRGDPSDGLPGVGGIGEKTAASLLTRWGTLAGVLAAAVDPGSGLTATQRRRLAEAEDYLAVAPRVVAVRRDVDIALPPPPPAGLRGAVDDEAATALAREWGAHGPLSRVIAAVEAASAAGDGTRGPGAPAGR